MLNLAAGQGLAGRLRAGAELGSIDRQRNTVREDKKNILPAWKVSPGIKVEDVAHL